jgi:hypothetical protein
VFRLIYLGDNLRVSIFLLLEVGSLLFEVFCLSGRTGLLVKQRMELGLLDLRVDPISCLALFAPGLFPPLLSLLFLQLLLSFVLAPVLLKVIY